MDFLHWLYNFRIVNYQAGDVGYIHVASSHWIENTGSEPLVYIEALQAPRHVDISAARCLDQTPEQVVKETLNVDQSFVNTLPKTKWYVVPGIMSLTNTNFMLASYSSATLNVTSEY